VEALLRELRQAADGIPEYHDTQFSGDTISVGSALDCTIQLLGEGVAAYHANIKRAGNAIQVTCKRGSRISANGKSCVSATLQPGDVVDINGHVLAFVEAPGGFDMAIEIRPNLEVQSKEYESAFRTDLSQTWLSKRPASWVLLILMLSIGLAIPFGLITLMDKKEMRSVSTWVPNDKLWLTGPLIPAHQSAMGDQCEACHEKPFQRIQDSACRECHAPIRDHVEATQLALTKLGPTERCAVCHREHNEPATYVVNRNDELCTDCHADTTQFGSITKFGQRKVGNVSGFGPSRHAPFAAYLIKPVAQVTDRGLNVDWKLEVADMDKAKEESNLKFSHTQHLDAQRVTRLSDSRPLNCADCHRLMTTGEHFEPITMAGRCSGCHELTFDEAAPDRQLPHGKPLDAIRTLQEYYLNKFSDPRAAQSAPQLRRDRNRRLPGREEEPVKVEVCTASTFECARRAANAQVDEQFTRIGCYGCHVVNDTKKSDVFERYQVYPVRLALDYFPAGSFPHDKHLIIKDRIGDEGCLYCHAAKKSSKSNDLLIPTIDNCFECHGDSQSKDRIKLECLDCHAYHPPSATTAKTVFTASAETGGK
jgi:predicted CXXCH cytochrome family protein